MPDGLMRLIVLGSTGSIGAQALEVVAHLNGLHERGLWPVRCQVVGLAAGRNAGRLSEQARAFGVADLALAADDGGEIDCAARLRRGPDSAERLVREVPCDVVLAAMVGVAGLPATLAAIELGRDVALANKETLVAAGELVIPAAGRSGSRLLPVDSEHSAIWQCLWARAQPGDDRDGPATRREACPPAPPMSLGRDVSRLILTASGGALRAWPAERAYAATPADALKHPTWSMGPKVTVDSASLMNKALEVIEAHWLFGIEAERIGVLVHPQSIVHSLVEYADGSVMAQLGAPDMKTPIQVALAFPHRVAAAGAALNWPALSRLDFEPADESRYPALGLARRAIHAGGAAGAVLNAANEAAVECFLAQNGARPMPLGKIAEVVAEAMSTVPASPVAGLKDVRDADAHARACVHERLRREDFTTGPAGSPRARVGRS